MNLKAIMMSAVVALTLSACAHKATQSCACGKDKASCSESKECPMHKGSGCEHCKESSDNAPSK